MDFGASSQIIALSPARSSTLSPNGFTITARGDGFQPTRGRRFPTSAFVFAGFHLVQGLMHARRRSLASRSFFARQEHTSAASEFSHWAVTDSSSNPAWQRERSPSTASAPIPQAPPNPNIPRRSAMIARTRATRSAKKSAGFRKCQRRQRRRISPALPRPSIPDGQRKCPA